MHSGKRPLDAVVFDLDGTLVDSSAAVIDAVATGIREVARRHGHENIVVVPEVLRRALGQPAAQYFRTVLPDTLQHLASEVKAAATEYEVRALVAGEGRLYPGVIDTLERLRAQGLRLAVISNAQEPYFHAALEHLGVDRLLDHRECHEELPDDARPPFKRALLSRALRQLDVVPQRAAMVGDREEDLSAGRELGCRTVAIAFGFGEAVELVGADQVVEQFTELVQVLGLEE